jgi:hypothetical protein
MTESVSPSQQPDAASAGGTGVDKGAAPPPPADQAASTSGVGSTQADQQGAGAPPADAPYSLTPEQDDEGSPASPSGT